LTSVPLPRNTSSAIWGISAPYSPLPRAASGGPVLVDRDPGDDEDDTDDLLGAGDLGEHDDADDGGRGRQQRHHQGVGGAGEAGHRELVADVGDHGGADPHAGGSGEHDRIGEGRRRLPDAPRQGDHRGDEHGQCEAVDPAQLPAAGQPVPEHDVGREQQGVGDGEGDAPRFGDQSDVGEQVHPGDRGGERCQVAAVPGGHRGQGDDGQELDPGDGTERKPVDGQVEHAVHRRQHRRQPGHQPPPRPVQAPPHVPGPAPAGEHQRGRRDPQPRHPQHVDAREEQDREGGPR
jgi:hypothetical protein